MATVSDYDKMIARLGTNTQAAVGAYALIAVSHHREEYRNAHGRDTTKFDPNNVKSDKVKNPKYWASFESLVAGEKGRIMPVVPKKEVGERLAAIATAPQFFAKAEKLFRPLNSVFGKVPNFDRNFRYEELFTRDIKAVFGVIEADPPADFGRLALHYLAVVKWVGLQAGHAAWDRAKFTLNDDALMTFLRGLELLGVDLMRAQAVTQVQTAPPAQQNTPVGTPVGKPVGKSVDKSVDKSVAQPNDAGKLLSNLSAAANNLSDDPQTQAAMKAILAQAISAAQQNVVEQNAAQKTQQNPSPTDAERNAEVPYDQILANLTAGDTSQ
jgi:hypothetical protein